MPLDTRQGEAGDGDRIVLAANTQLDRPLQERSPGDAITKDALQILQGLGANFVTTSTLFEIWMQLQTDDDEAARQRLLSLHSQDGGHFT